MLAIGSKAPGFSAPDQDGKIHKLSDYKGRWLLLYFYPKDNTPGCTTEACTIRDSYADFQKIGAAVLGVSKDSVKSHTGFAGKYNLPFPILSDGEKTIIKAYGADGLFARISYLIDPNGIVAKAYEKVKPAEHAAEAINDLRELAAA
jgi:thioredoxin-dependent peroxiredoxin